MPPLRTTKTINIIPQADVVKLCTRLIRNHYWFNCQYDHDKWIIEFSVAIDIDGADRKLFSAIHYTETEHA